MENAKDTVEKLCKGKAVALWGKGVSTKSVEALLKRLGATCVYYSEEENFTKEKAKNHALAIYSPSFKNDHPFFKTAKENNVECMGEPDLAGLLWQGKIIAVTGTNGKTTLTSFIAHALKKIGIDALELGNIGMPMCDFADKSAKKFAVCELSSFQGMRLKHLHPNALVWTNFAPDHLDWHASMKEYFEAKLQIAKLLKEEIFIAGSGVKEAAKEFEIALPSCTIFVDKNSEPDAPAPFDNSIQKENFALAKALWKKLGLNENILCEAAKDFSLAAHRFSMIKEIEGVRFWNDSKATNAHAAIAALKHLQGKKVFWIGGGKNKYCDLAPLIAAIKETASGVALIGQTAEILKEKLPEMPMGVNICKSLDEAVELAYKSCKNEGNVLFSPAFSSFGMFDGYADRGKSFEKSVLCLNKTKKT